jgi:putative peptidoglycan lipid II flippase
MKLYRAFFTVGGLTMISRILGFVRDILFAAAFGSGWVADAFNVGFRFPNLFRRLFGEGAFNSAFIPLFAKRLEGDGKDAARAFAEEALAGLVFVLTLLTIAAIVFMPWLMYLLAPGFASNPEKFDLAVLLTRIMFPYLMCMSLVALMSGVLNTVGKFAESAGVSIVLNLTLTVALFIGFALGYRNDPQGGIVQAIGVFIAGLLQLALLMDGLRRAGFRLKLRRPRMTDGMRRLLSLGVPGVISGGVTQINIMIGTIIASLEAGAVSQLYYADRLYELPLAIVGIAIGVVLLPEVSRHLRAGNQAAVHDSQNRSLELAMLLTIPAAVALAIVPAEIIRVLFERGAFTPTDTAATAAALAIFAWGLPAFVLIKVFSPAYFAREDTRTPMRYATISLIANTAGSVGLFFLFRSMGMLPQLGIALASALGGWLNAILLWRTLSARGHFTLDARAQRALPMIVLSSLLMGLALWAGANVAAPWLTSSQPLAVKAAALAALLIAALLIYGAIAFATGALRKSLFRRPKAA